MASSTAPITSSRGAADTTAGRIYFSTPSAQVRVPVGDLVFPPPTSAHTILLGGNYKGASAEGSRGNRERKCTAGRQTAEKLSRGGVKIIRRRNNYPGRARVDQNSKKKNLKVPKTVAQCRKYPIPYLYTLSRTIPYLYTLNRTVPYLYTLNRLIPYLNTLNRIIPYVNTLSRTIPYLNTLNRIIPYVNTLSRTIPYLNTLNRTIPYLNTLSRTIPYLNTLRKNPNLAQNQILVGSQSELSTKKP